MIFPPESLDETFEELEVAHDALDGLRFERCRFVRCRFDTVRFRGCRFEECVFEDCDLVACKWPDAALVDVQFERGRVMGADFTGLRPFGLEVRFTGCRMDHSVFAEIGLRKTRFLDCSLREVDFGGCDLRDVVMKGSDLSGASIRRADLRGADLRGARGCRVDHETCKVGKTKVDADTGLLVLEAIGFDCPELDAMFR